MNENSNKRVNLHIYNEENYTKLKMLAMIGLCLFCS
ncbi:hypothetical protein MBCUT_10760 [Methanobrevibacter cuticularis]|uniref:Uncharacterized protein n=1 Tax=Methanobrevibacter cuticularis TaxID=47311 RepID=A0A166DYX5_9EURY|nr:hypothetical protein MBCUT_10760 [Methanobrevibacter cuticularis]